MLSLAKCFAIQEMIFDELQCILKNDNLKELASQILNKLRVFKAFIREVMKTSTVFPVGMQEASHQGR